MLDAILFQFEADGYVVLEDFLTEEEVSELKSECDVLVKNMPEEGNRTVFSSADSNKQQVEIFLTILRLFYCFFFNFRIKTLIF